MPTSRPGSVPDPGQPQDREGVGPPHAAARHERLPAVRAVRRHQVRLDLACRFGRDLEPSIERPATRRLDKRRRGRAAHPAGARPLQSGAVGRHQPCHPLHRPGHLRLHYPARHQTADPCSNLPPMGLRVRLKASVDISGFGPQARVVLTALKRYGMILATTGRPGTSPASRAHTGTTTSSTFCRP